MDSESVEDVWVRSVRRALSEEETEVLADLFAQAQNLWGSQQASRMWLETVSAFDAHAVTG